MLAKTNAIVIKSLKYGDTSLIVNCYCEDFGLQAFILKGILKTKKGKYPKKSLFEPLKRLPYNELYQMLVSQG